MRKIILVFVFILVACSPVYGSEPDEEKEGSGLVHKIAFYVPNRILDILDLARLRVRVGPGMAFGVRATEAADLFFGSYASVYAGLPGPRNRKLPKLPIGAETKTGVEVSVADVTTEGLLLGPDYSPTEFGFGLHALLLGFDAGVDPMELLDLAAGILFIDLRNDDF